MPMLTTDDGVDLYYEVTGDGSPIVFVHEFAGDYRSFEPQVRYFSRRYKCVTYCARGYPPSQVPPEVSSYSQDRAREDLYCILDGLGLERAHVVGISMGSFAALHFGLAYPDRARSLVLGGCGSGAPNAVREQFQSEAMAMADALLERGMERVARAYASSATRLPLSTKDPKGWVEFAQMLSEHSALGSANTMRGVQAQRPSLYDLQPELEALRVPTLIVVGDEDEPCLEPSLYLKRTIASGALGIFPKTGHALNLEEPALFNQFLEGFFHQVEAGIWPLRNTSPGDRPIIRNQ